MFGAEERKEVNDVLETGILMRYGFDGPRKGTWKAKELEHAIQRRLGAAYVQLTSSGTTAVTTALAALGVGAGDEVIMPTFTFVASFEAVLSTGAIPVLVDVDETLTLDPEAVRKAVNEKTRCVMPVHMCGAMADLDALSEICKEFNLLLLEDACQSIGASYHGRYLGTIGHAGTFSFDFVKTVTCGEGGAVLTNDESTYHKCDHYADHGHDHKGVDRGADEHPFMGQNFRISELHAAVGLAQFRKLDSFLAIQRRNCEVLKSYLAGVPGLTFRSIPDPAGDSATFLTWMLPSETLVREALAAFRERGIAGGQMYWYEHNWHYIRKWHHLKEGQSLYSLNEGQKAAIARIKVQDFAASDAIMSRSVSTAIQMGWTPELVLERGKVMAEVLTSVMSVTA